MRRLQNLVRASGLVLCFIGSVLTFQHGQYENAEWLWAGFLAQVAMTGSMKDKTKVVPVIAAIVGILTVVALFFYARLEYWEQMAACLLPTVFLFLRYVESNDKHSWFNKKSISKQN